MVANDLVKTVAKKRLSYLGTIILILIPFLVYLQTFSFGFINFDDPGYVYKNHHVKEGLTLSGIHWAFTSFHAANWHPLTWLSHMMDVDLFGMNAGGHHFINVLLHIITTVTLFRFLSLATGSNFKSGLAAFIFAIHPLHIESVAWISERKDVLSTMFGMLSLLLYHHYTRSKKNIPYIASLTLFAFSLLAKPMLVTLPCLLLLLDYWPLNRFNLHKPQFNHIKTIHRKNGKEVFSIWVEKIPFFILAAGSSWITILAQQSGQAIASFQHLPIMNRIINAIMTYWGYIMKFLYPSHLAVYYPYPEAPGVPVLLAVATLLILITLLSFRFIKPLPWLFTGWNWYLGTLVPVIGLIQVGDQAMADRYTYFPTIGASIVLVWGGASLSSRSHLLKKILGSALACILMVMTITTYTHIKVWKDSYTLFSHARNVTQNNWMAALNIGVELAERGLLDEAIPYYHEAIAIRSDLDRAYFNIGSIYYHKGQYEKAINYLRTAKKLNPYYEETYQYLSMALIRKEQFQEAADILTQATKIQPENDAFHYSLGNTLIKLAKHEKAVHHYQQALKINQKNINIYCMLGITLAMQGRFQDAVDQFNLALSIDPQSTKAHVNLCRIYWMMGDEKMASEELIWIKQHDMKQAEILQQMIHDRPAPQM